MEIISQLLPFIFLIAIMYFVIIRPQQKEAKSRKEMIEALAKGEKVEIRGFGTLLMKERAARVARNPQTGKKVKIPAKLSPAFKPGKELKAIEKVIK